MVEVLSCCGSGGIELYHRTGEIRVSRHFEVKFVTLCEEEEKKNRCEVKVFGLSAGQRFKAHIR